MSRSMDVTRHAASDHDSLIEQLRVRAGDDDQRVDERPDAMTAMLGALPLDQLVGMLSEGGAALRGLLGTDGGPTGAFTNAGPSGGPMIGAFDVLGMTRLAATPAPVERRSPATAADVARAEALLGLTLPLLLARIYTEVADGGFGPGAGLLPLLESPGSHGRSMVGEHESVCEASEHGYGAPWPTHLLPIASWSDGAVAAVDTRNEPHPVWEIDLADLEDTDDAPWTGPASAPSLEAWLRRWLAS
jgi:SMI1 / KNR4 family (SUKH-1)